MNEKVLFVDDDPALLSMLKRNFAVDFDVSTRESGHEAIKLIESKGPFACVMVDMRMPEMDGLEVIKKARKISPDTIYIMLTGNQDLTTAIEAVNQGHVFRFLNKPCEVDSIRSTLRAALRQYDLVASQKELLGSTFTGAIGVLTEIIESMEAPPADSNRVKELALRLADRMKIESTWAMSLASQLMFIGVPLLPLSKKELLVNCSVRKEDHQNAVKLLLELSLDLIRKIPRLGPVTDILKHAIKVDGTISSFDSHSQQFACLMVISFYAELLLQRDPDKRTVIHQLVKTFDGLDSAVLQAVEKELQPPPEPKPRTKQEPNAPTEKCLAPSDLKEGMVVASHVRQESGAVLVAQGRVLTSALIQRLRLLAQERPFKVQVLSGGSALNRPGRQVQTTS